MIKTYKEEIYSRRNKNAIFRLVVFIFSVILFLFFQWFYIKLNIEVNNPQNTIKTTLKQFWIVNIRTSQSPDNIYINWKNYQFWDKKILDYWNYKIEIFWKNTFPVTFNINLNKDYPIFFETIHLFNKFKYKNLWVDYDKIYKVDDSYFVFQKNSKLIEVHDSNFILNKMFLSEFVYLWYKYFSNNWLIYYYDFSSNSLKQLIKWSDEEWVYCSSPRVINNSIFCNDTMSFLDWTKVKWSEPIIDINSKIIKTENYLYNNSSLWNWWTYKYKNKFINNPINLVHLDNIPLVLEDWFLHYLDNKKNIKYILPDIQIIKNAIDYGDETILIWFKWNERIFEIISWKKRYYWNLWDIDLSKLQIEKINWVYFFNSWKNLYVYYKGSPYIQNILEASQIQIINNIVFFKKDNKAYYIDLTKED